MIAISIVPGTYVIAVSGGVDSVVLLDVLRKQPDITLTVAHFDHGIRVESAADRQFTERLAKRYQLPFVYETAQLGTHASEATAREARYAFLTKTKLAVNAQAIITAHHQDDVLETMAINVLRGTGRKGLSSLRSTRLVARPLLNVPKAAIISYAQDHKLDWREDQTNTSTKYLRNRVRQRLAGQSATTKRQLLAYNERAMALNDEIDILLRAMVRPELDRDWFIGLPHRTALEVMAAWLRSHLVADFSAMTLERLVIAAKVATVGANIDATNHYKMMVSPTVLALRRQER